MTGTGLGEKRAAQGQAPVHVLQCEPGEVHSLQWMPLAVRYKLDVLGLTMGLKTWQALPLALRSTLLQMDVATAPQLAACRTAFLDANARSDPERLHRWENFDCYVQARRGRPAAL